MGDPLTRRGFLGATAAGVAAGLAACRADLSPTGPAPAAETSPAPRPAPSGRMRVSFVGHGSPELARDAAKGGQLAAWTAAQPRPSAILVVSAHWERAPATLGATRPVPLIYDFRGFPAPLYALRYDAPGAPALADRVEGLLRAHGPVARAPDRGLDHGAWVPLSWMYRDADVPVLPLSLPTQEPAALLRIGRALAPLRDEGVLILGSGNVVHNLRRLDGRPGAPPPAWAAEFDAWTAEALRRADLDALADYRRRAPAADIAHPTKEHWVPLLLVASAGFATGGTARFPVTGFEAGSISRRCVDVG